MTRDMGHEFGLSESAAHGESGIFTELVLPPAELP